MEDNMKTAQDQMLAGAQVPTSSLQSIRDQLAEKHGEHPQRAQLADLALRSVEQGLAELAKLGHVFHLVEGRMAEVEEFPKMLYFDGPQGLEERVVQNRIEEDEAKADGWRDHPATEPEQIRQPEELSSEHPHLAPRPESVGETKEGLDPNTDRTHEESQTGLEPGLDAKAVHDENTSISSGEEAPSTKEEPFNPPHTDDEEEHQ